MGYIPLENDKWWRIHRTLNNSESHGEMLFSLQLSSSLSDWSRRRFQFGANVSNTSLELSKLPFTEKPVSQNLQTTLSILD